MGVPRKNRDAGHFTVAVGFSGFHDEVGGVLHAPHRSVALAALLLVGLPDLGKGIGVGPSDGLIQRLIHAHRLHPLEELPHQRMADGGGCPHHRVDGAHCSDHQFRGVAPGIDHSHGQAQIPVHATAHGTGEVEQPAGALLDQALNLRAFHGVVGVGGRLRILCVVARIER